MKKLLLILSILFYTALLATGQSLQIDSTRFVTGNSCCTGISYTIQTNDGGIFFAGVMSHHPGGIIPYLPLDTVFENVFVGKIDNSRQIEWLKAFGGSKDDGAASACQTPDSGFAVLAQTGSNDGDITGYKGSGDIWLLRLDQYGNLLWEKTYGSTSGDVATSVANTPDHGFIILGTSSGSDDDVPFHYGDYFAQDWIVIKTDSSGNVQWSKDLGGSEDETYNGTILSIDTSYYLVSTSASTDHDCTDNSWHPNLALNYDYYILKLDSHGNVLWDSSYGGSGNDIVYSALYDSRDSSLVITGGSSSNDYMATGNHGDHDMLTVKTDLNGTVKWIKQLGGPSTDDATGITCKKTGGYLVYGKTFPEFDTTWGDIGEQDCMIIDIDNNGNTYIKKIFGGIDYDTPSSIIPSLNGYAAAGLAGTYPFTEGISDGNYSGAFISYIDYWPTYVNYISESNVQIQVYPNPAQNLAKIILPDNVTGIISIYNCLGQQMQKSDAKNGFEINVSDWQKGLYLVKWQGDNGATSTSKLIKE